MNSDEIPDPLCWKNIMCFTCNKIVDIDYIRHDIPHRINPEAIESDFNEYTLTWKHRVCDVYVKAWRKVANIEAKEVNVIICSDKCYSDIKKKYKTLQLIKEDDKKN